MRFGAVPVAEAIGAILGHTTRLDARTLKKGHRLTEDDARALAAAGHATVVVARLDDGDVHEDRAADRVGACAAGPGVAPRAAEKGRADLFATRAGLLVLDRARLDEVNLVDEAVTIATLEPYARVEAGDFVATVKIIPFAVPEAALREVERRAGPNLLSVAPIVPRRAGLVLTTLPGVHPSQLDRAEEAQRRRMRALGGDLGRVLRAPHTPEDVRDAILTLHHDGLSPILILGASAITDRDDVVPDALRRAGGAVTHFGMPVDPGNLLLFGDLGGVPVIGVPGCARSLAPSGFDRVLERVTAGLEVTRQDIMRMGAGGLMKDTDQRQEPRRGGASPGTPRVAAVVLAAGQSRRMGKDNKLLSDVGGRPMVRGVVEMLRETRAGEIVVVVGHEAARVREALSGLSVATVENAAYAEGLSTSIRAGAHAVAGRADAVLFVLADMPWVQAAHVDRLIEAFDPAAGRAICVPIFEGRRGNPVLWAARFLPEMERLTGDVGAKPLLAAHADQVFEVSVEDRGVHFDVDTPEALAELLRPG